MVSFVLACVVVHTIVMLGYYTGVDYEGGQKFGQLAKDIGEGLLGALDDYRVYKREGGAFPFAGWVALFYALLGPSIFALKLSSLTLAALGTWPWVDLARRLAGPRAALVAALLFVLPPAYYQTVVFSAAITPTHIGVVMFSGLALWFLYRGFGDRTLGEIPAAIGVGAATGAGIFWVFTMGPAAVGIAITVLLFRVRWRRIGVMVLAGLPFVVAAVLISLLPALAQERGLFGMWQETGGKPAFDLVALLHKTWLTLTRHLAAFGAFLPGRLKTGVIPPTLQIAAATYYGLALVAMGALAVGARRGRGAARRVSRRTVALLVPAPAYLIGYLLTDPPTGWQSRFDGYRYLVPLVPFAVLAVAVAAGVYLRGGRPLLRAARTGLVVLVVVLGLIGEARLFDPSDFPTPLLYLRGYNVAYYGPDRRQQAAVRGLQMPGRSDYPALARMLGENRPPRKSLRDGRDVPGLAKVLWRDYWEGVGAGFRKLAAKGGGDAGRMLRFALGAGDIDRRCAIATGYAHGTFPPISIEELPRGVEEVRELAVSLRLPEQEVDALVEAAYRGLGQAELWWAGRTPIPDAQMQAYMEGLAIEFARNLIPWRGWPRERALPEPLAGPEQVYPRLRRTVEDEVARQREILDRFRTVAPLMAVRP